MILRKTIKKLIKDIEVWMSGLNIILLICY
jgi:hypothetical protein